MAVVQKKASAYVDVTAPPISQLPAEVSGRGMVAPLVSTVELANGNSATSTVFFGKVPSNARFSVGSRIDFDALTGVTDFSLGLGRLAELGVDQYVVGSAACLIANADIHTAGSKAFTAIDIADLPKAAWQIAGYADDPGGDLDIVGTLNAAATAAGTITLSAFLFLP